MKGLTPNSSSTLGAADFPLVPGEGAARLALLRHWCRAPGPGLALRSDADAGTSGATAHLDLFLGPESPIDGDARVARSWRLPLSAWDRGWISGVYQAIETPPHRAIYLGLTERVELSNARGVVEPIVATSCRARVDGTRVVIEAAHLTIRAELLSAETWRLEITDTTP